MFKRLRKNFFTGLIVLLPAVVTILLIRFVVIKTNLLLLEPIAGRLKPYLLGNVMLEYLMRGTLFILIVLIIVLIGYGTRVLLLRTFFSYLEKLFFKVPMIGKIYSAVREMSKAFLGHSKWIFKRVVLVQYPRKGIYSIGFVTSEAKEEVQDKTVEKLVSVLIPTTPTPLSGFLILVPEEELINLDMTIEEGLKLVISGGIVPLPDRISVKKNEHT
ncbi:MAG: DUF502 domain-containing protein [Candidatus Omnitrophota bacterium]|nr:DUF502 domain-containing protein [Candidatus Omnitrophota bacterium]